MDQLSTESRALRRSNVVFNRGVDPNNLVTVLYSNLLLTPQEKAQANQRTETDDVQAGGDFHDARKARISRAKRVPYTSEGSPRRTGNDSSGR